MKFSIYMRLSQLEYFYKKHALFYDLTRPLFLFDRKKAIELLDIKRDNTVIDVACGTGLNMPFLLKKTTADKIIGIDYSKSMLQQARKKYPAVYFVKGDVAIHQFPKKVSKIICTYSLSMIEDWQNTIINMKKTLKRDGTLVILDFHPWYGIITPLYLPFRWWLKKHGVDPEKKVVHFLKAHFDNVEELLFHSGYNHIVIAKLPKL